MKIVSGGVQIRYGVCHFHDLLLKDLLAVVLLLQLFFKLLAFFLKVFRNLLLLVVELHDKVVHHFYLLRLSRNNFLVILLNQVVIHLCVALITHSMLFCVVLGELAPCL